DQQAEVFGERGRTRLGPGGRRVHAEGMPYLQLNCKDHLRSLTVERALTGRHLPSLPTAPALPVPTSALFWEEEAKPVDGGVLPAFARARKRRPGRVKSLEPSRPAGDWTSKSGLGFVLGRLLLFLLTLALHEADNVRRKSFIHSRSPKEKPRAGARGFSNPTASPNTIDFV